jgi:ATP-binding cassette subfamily B protein
MTRFRIDLRGGAFRSVFRFVGQHWARQPWRIGSIFGAMLLATMVDVALVALGVAALVFRQTTFTMIITLTLRMMRDMAADGFHRVQRFSTDWHANTFAGSTVRKITRAIWALDLLNDTVLIALFPSS